MEPEDGDGPRAKMEMSHDGDGSWWRRRRVRHTHKVRRVRRSS